jgi:hypothetical protein
MCTPTSALRFCTCDAIAQETTAAHWKLCCNPAGEQIMIVGAPSHVAFSDDSRIRRTWQRHIRKALDRQNPFDFAYATREGDHFSVHITIDNDPEDDFSHTLKYGYIFTRGR